ncbi:hypothetical protein IWW37_001091 [Coemansia sp. RSA 2050]|nr:hypothetical protein IWW37_001091 [Coemansia sp. RSA 2050]KAJ2737081.1 hypothetical protein IW152_000344 [Coemansia sp. BCRC 34962]
MKPLLAVQLLSTALSVVLASNEGVRTSAAGNHGIFQRAIVPTSESSTSSSHSSSSTSLPTPPQAPKKPDAAKDVDLGDVGQAKKCSVEGSAVCSSDAPNRYWACNKGKWASMKCDGKNVCAQTDDSTVVCHDPKGPVVQKPQESVPCKTNKSTMCNSADSSSFYVCLKNVWALETCLNGSTCHIVDGAAVCMKPKSPTEPGKEPEEPKEPKEPKEPEEPKEPCSTPNESKCDASNRSNFFVCTKNTWTKMECDGENVCMFRNGKTSCVDKTTADAPVQPCTKEKETRCASDNKDIFQICQDKYWTNSTCSSGNVCGMKQGSALCHDPKQPIIDVPDQPCVENSPNRCVPGDNRLYQICYDKLWNNNTCTDDKVCIMIKKAAACVDKDVALSISPTNTLREPEVFVPNDNRADSVRNMYSWGVGGLLCVVGMAFGFVF